jgi:hypothetical protein
MIARQTEIVFRPKTKRHSRIGIMSPDDVENDEGGEQKIRRGGKFQATMSEDENDDENDEQ